VTRVTSVAEKLPTSDCYRMNVDPFRVVASVECEVFVLKCRGSCRSDVTTVGGCGKMKC
jgi:hypothetical protein